MSAKFEPQWQERRANIDPKTGARQERLLVIGTDADKIAGAFAKLLPQCHIQSATRADHAILAMSSGHFDATLVDCRDDERFHRLAIVAARQFKQGRVALLASDHFLPDETAVIENLDIFSSSDDSTKLLASLRLEPKRPARKRKAAAPRGAEDSAGFEAALRAELDALHARPAESLPIAPAQIMASAPPAIGEASGTASWKMPHRVWRAEARVLVPAGGEAAQADDPGFLDTLASELEQVELFEDVAETSVQTEGQSARLDYASGNIDLFGNPASNLNEIRLLAGEADANGATESVVGATDSAFEGPDLFDAAATAQAAAEARACALALEAEAAETAISLAVDEISQALDSLMASEPEGFSISVPAPEIEPQLEAAETSPSQAIGSRDLFGGEIDAALQRGASAGDEIETSGGARCPETMDLFAAPVLPEAKEVTI